MGELWDLYNDKREPLGKTCLRGAEIHPGEYHLVVEIWVVDGKGKVLLTRRHPDKTHPNQWECTIGAVVAGEDSMTGALRELGEEIGIIAAPSELCFIGSVVSKRYILDSYILTKEIEISQLRLQPSEVTGARWVDYSELCQMQAQGLLVPAAWERFGRIRDKLIGK